MDSETARPTFLTAYFRALSESAKARGIRAIIPVWVIASLLVGVAVSYYVPLDFWSGPRWDVSTAVYSGILTFNGLILALSWNSFGRIHQIISEAGFCSYLRKKNLLNDYIVFISYVHAAQLTAITFSAIGLFSVLIEIRYILVDRAIMALTIAATVYAVKTSASSVGLMHDLVYQKAVFDDHFIDDSRVVKFAPKGQDT